MDVLGGPDYEVSCPNGDRTPYVTAVHETRIIAGSPASGDSELSELAWFTPEQLPRPAAEPTLPRPPSRHGPTLIHNAPSL